MIAATAILTLVWQGFVAGWSVAWPPGPINAEVVRRGLAGRLASGFAIGLGACTGDFLWAIAVASGFGYLERITWVRWLLAGISLVLLLALATLFLRAAWRGVRRRRNGLPPTTTRSMDASRGFLLGLTMALSSPWNVAFWVGVIGQRAHENLGFRGSLVFAAAVVGGALTWITTLCTALRLGARFATPTWEIVTNAATGLLMLYFAGRLVIQAWAKLAVSSEPVLTAWLDSVQPWA